MNAFLRFAAACFQRVKMMRCRIGNKYAGILVDDVTNHKRHTDVSRISRMVHTKN